jgi:hypothetical protein
LLRSATSAAHRTNFYPFTAHQERFESPTGPCLGVSGLLCDGGGAATARSTPSRFSPRPSEASAFGLRREKRIVGACLGVGGDVCGSERFKQVRLLPVAPRWSAAQDDLHRAIDTAGAQVDVRQNRTRRKKTARGSSVPPDRSPASGRPGSSQRMGTTAAGRQTELGDGGRHRISPTIARRGKTSLKNYTGGHDGARHFG